MLQIFRFSIQNICCGILFIMSWFFVLPTGNTGTWLLTTNIRVSFYSNMPSHILIWASLSQLKLHFNVDGREIALTGTQLLLIYYKCYWSTTSVIDLLDLDRGASVLRGRLFRWERWENLHTDVYMSSRKRRTTPLTSQL